MERLPRACAIMFRCLVLTELSPEILYIPGHAQLYACLLKIPLFFYQIQFPCQHAQESFDIHQS